MRYVFLIFIGFLFGCGGEGDFERGSEAPSDAASYRQEEVKLSARKSLEKILAEREALSEMLWKKSREIEDMYQLGTAHNEIGVQEGRCYAIGTILGFDDYVFHLNSENIEIFVVHENLIIKDLLVADDAYYLQVAAIWYANFAHEISKVLGFDEKKINFIWNSDCRGSHGIPTERTYVYGDNSSFYEIINDGRTLVIRGDIDNGYAEKVISALEANPSVEVVGLGSGGGLVREALLAGIYIHKNGYDTVLINNCYSACPLVFMGGKQRTVWSPYPKFGFHQVYYQDGRAVDFDDEIYARIFDYLLLKGINPSYVLGRMWSAEPGDMAIVPGDEHELCAAKVVTWAQRSCSSEDYL